jgi:hypothetical protein
VTRKSKVQKTRKKSPRSSPPARPALPSVDPTPLLWYAAGALLIALAVVGVYWNTLDNEFVSFDDRKYIYENEFVIGDGGLGAIWGDLVNKKPKLHYNPVTYTSFWIEYQLVGPFPDPKEVEGAMGQPAHPLIHVDQMVLHAINACLVLLVLRALGVSFPVSLFTAFFFALHPVNVASVAWMAERKNLLSGLFLWTSLLLYVNHRRLVDRSLAYKKGLLQWLYVAALAAFALALLAKAAALVLAPVILITDRLLDRKWSWAAVRRATPFFILGLFSASMVTARERLIAKSWEEVPGLYRPFIAVAAVLAYVATMLWPVRQAIIYPRWEVSLANPRYWISIVIAAGAAYLIWRYRKWLGDTWLWGLGLFLLTVAPILGLKPFIWTQFAFHSDHYMYFGSPGVLLMIGLLLERFCRPTRTVSGPDGETTQRIWNRARVSAVGFLCVLALVGCGWRVTQQNKAWAHNKALWSHNIEIAPDTMVARMNLGNHYFRHGEYELALEQYREFARIRPDWARARRSCGRAARNLGRHDEAIDYFRQAAEMFEAKNPRSLGMRRELADYLTALKRYEEALEEYETLLERNASEPDKLRRIIEQLKKRIYSKPPPVSELSPDER